MRKKAERELHCWRVVVVYTDDEASGNRVFKDGEKAERWAARQKKSKAPGSVTAWYLPGVAGWSLPPNTGFDRSAEKSSSNTTVPNTKRQSIFISALFLRR
jgi:hypothetical protein